ncbi:hypothetical protein [Streptomyces sp. NPDC046939]|uniref:hypothetical protein n=1 Tax=Streptomyces sp. NPDC046939 TaxID=3155376 RepID=UPI0033E2A0B9
MHSPEELWAMVEPADGGTASDLGALLTAAAKTIKEIGGDLKTHSTSVQWEGEGADAFHKWIDQAARATLSLGDYSETAGKWLGHAADTLHEVKPQIEALKNSSASARSVLDAHDAASKDVGNHDGGPSTSAVKTAKTQYDNDRAEAALLMTKLAQSYAASTEQIEALQAPEFPELPERFVPWRRDGREDVSPSSDTPPGTGTAAAVSGVGVAAAGAAALKEAAHGASLAGGGHQASPTHQASPLSVPPRAVPYIPPSGPNTGLDGVGALPPPAAPAPSPTATTPPSSLPGGAPSLATPPPGAPAIFGGAGRSAAPQRGPGGGRGPTAPFPRGPLAASEDTGRAGTPGVAGTPRGAAPERGVSGAARPGVPAVEGGRVSPVRGPGPASPERSPHGIAGGRAASTQTGRAAGSIPRGTVVGGSPAQQAPGSRAGTSEGARRGTTSPGRGIAAGSGHGSGVPGARMPAHADGVAGGQPQKAKPNRNASAAVDRSGLARRAADDPAEARRGPTGSSSASSRKDAARTVSAPRPRGERSAEEGEQPEEDKAEPEQQTAQSMPAPRLPGLPHEKA